MLGWIFNDYRYPFAEMRTEAQSHLDKKRTTEKFNTTEQFNRTYRFNKKRTWTDLTLQTAGVMCAHPAVLGTILKPTPQFRTFVMEPLARKYWGANISSHSADLEKISDYDGWLQRKDVGLTCRNSFRYFEEGLYPIDLPENSKTRAMVCQDKIPQDINAAWHKKTKNDPLAIFTHLPQPILFVVTQNSD